MTCELWRDQIEMYVDGELASPHESEVARHLRGCAECTAFAAEAMHLKRGVATAGKRFELSEDFRGQLVKNLGAREPFRFGVLLPRLAIAAVLLIAIALGAFMLSRHGEDKDREIADIHLNTIASVNPVDVISTDQHTVKPWFQGKVPFTFNVPDLTNSPFTLIGGRVVYVRGTPTALLLFQYKLHKISVLIGPSSVLGSGEETRQLTDGFHLVRWEKEGRSFVTVGDAEIKVINDLAQKLKAAE